MRKQLLPLRNHPHGNVPLAGSEIASDAPCDGTQSVHEAALQGS